MSNSGEIVTPQRCDCNISQVADVRLPSRFGDFKLVAFESDAGEELIACIRGDIDGEHSVATRVHSECFTGDVLGSLRCDCRDQLEQGLRYIGDSDCGVVLYLPQEGRGIGLFNKLRAYALQDEGLDTVEANIALGFPDDLRRYDLAAAMLCCLGVKSVRLLTNNPKKIEGLSDCGVIVEGVIPLRIPPNKHNAAYLDTKRKKSGHLL